MAGHTARADGPTGLSLDKLKAASMRTLATAVSKARHAWQTTSADGKAGYLVIELPVEELLDPLVEKGWEVENIASALNSAPSPRLRDALARAFERGEIQAARILAGDEMLDPAAMAARLGVTRQTVHAWGKSGKLLALSSAKRGVRYPDWQLDETGQPLAGLKKLAEALGGGGWTLYRFLMQTHPELDGKRGLDALKQNRLTDLLGVADGIGAGNFT